MKTFVREFTFAAARICALMLATVACNAFAASDTLTIIHINDTHSHLIAYNGGKTGGIARAASVIGSWKKSEPNAVLVHSGDFLVGSLESNVTWGVPELQMLNAMGFDVLCLGNHEFDAGPSQLAQIFSQAALDSTFHIISSNAQFPDTTGTSGLRQLVQPFAIVKRGNLKIGFIGLTTPSANLESNPAPVFLDTELVVSTNTLAQTLRAQGCQIVIISSHLGLPTDMNVAAYLTGIDAIIGGHSHTLLDTVVYVNNIPIVQAEAFYHYVGKLQLIYDGTHTHVGSYTVQELNESIPAEHTTDSIVQSLKLMIDAQYTSEVGDPYAKISTACTRINYYPVAFDTLDTPLGNLLTDAMHADTNAMTADFALEPTGHMAEDIWAGGITRADAFRVYPYGYDPSDAFGFRLAKYQLTGAQLSGAMSALISFVDPTTAYYEYLAQSSGLDFTVVAGPSALSIGAITIAGKPLAPDSLYTIASSDRVVGYLQELFQIVPTNIHILPVSVVEVLMNYISKQDTVCTEATGHNHVVFPADVRDARSAPLVPGVSLMACYPNPSHGATLIPFHVASAGAVKIEIVDCFGATVRTLVNAENIFGDHVATWDGNDAHGGRVPSGAYQCRMISDQNVATKMLLIAR